MFWAPVSTDKEEWPMPEEDVVRRAEPHLRTGRAPGGRKASKTRSRAVTKALRREGRSTATKASLARRARRTR